jgi:hypothetical protein
LVIGFDALEISFSELFAGDGMAFYGLLCLLDGELNDIKTGFWGDTLLRRLYAIYAQTDDQKQS